MATKLKDGLYISDAEASQDPEFMELNKIHFVLNCAGNELPNLWEEQGVRYLTFPWDDESSCVLFDLGNLVVCQIAQFVDEALATSESILIHSFEGTSRCVAAVMAYFMFRYRWSCFKAFDFLSSKRPDIDPRPFMDQLYMLDQRLCARWYGAGCQPPPHEQIRRDKWEVVPDAESAGGMSASRLDLVPSDEVVLIHSYLNSQSLLDVIPPPALPVEEYHPRELHWIDQPRLDKLSAAGRTGLHGNVVHSVPRCPVSGVPVPERPHGGCYSSLLPGVSLSSTRRHRPKSILKKWGASDQSEGGEVPDENIVKGRSRSNSVSSSREQPQAADEDATTTVTLVKSKPELDILLDEQENEQHGFVEEARQQQMHPHRVPCGESVNTDATLSASSGSTSTVEESARPEESDDDYSPLGGSLLSLAKAPDPLQRQRRPLDGALHLPPATSTSGRPSSAPQASNLDYNSRGLASSHGVKEKLLLMPSERSPSATIYDNHHEVEKEKKDSCELPSSMRWAQPNPRCPRPSSAPQPHAKNASQRSRKTSSRTGRSSSGLGSVPTGYGSASSSRQQLSSMSRSRARSKRRNSTGDRATPSVAPKQPAGSRARHRRHSDSSLQVPPKVPSRHTRLQRPSTPALTPAGRLRAYNAAFSSTHNAPSSTLRTRTVRHNSLGSMAPNPVVTSGFGLTYKPFIVGVKVGGGSSSSNGEKPRWR